MDGLFGVCLVVGYLLVPGETFAFSTRFAGQNVSEVFQTLSLPLADVMILGDKQLGVSSSYLQPITGTIDVGDLTGPPVTGTVGVGDPGTAPVTGTVGVGDPGTAPVTGTVGVGDPTTPPTTSTADGDNPTVPPTEGTGDTNRSSSQPTIGPTRSTNQPNGAVLCNDAAVNQVIEFNPNAALQKRIFVDGYVPNSSEFDVQMQGTQYVAQRAEQLSSGNVRVYYVGVGDWANVQYADDSPLVHGSLEQLLVSEAAVNQVIEFNPNAALQKRIFVDGYVPNSSEFEIVMQGIEYIAQRAEDLRSGNVRVYYVRIGDWANVQIQDC